MTRENRPAARFGFALALGLVLIATGTVLALEKAGLAVPVEVTRLWPMLLVLVGLARLAQRGFLRIGGHLLVYLGLFFEGLLTRPETTLSVAAPAGLLWLGVIITLRALWPAFRKPTADDASPNTTSSCCD